MEEGDAICSQCGTNKLTKQVDLEGPDPLMDQVYLGCSQRKCEPDLEILKEHKKYSNL